jgi:vitamin B12 transporter
MNTYVFLTAATLSSLSACASFWAQANNYELETITISGTHAPIALRQVAGAVTIIDEKRIKASGAINISDLLRTVAGINIGQSGTSTSLSEVRFRGAESNHVMVLLDGVQINDSGQGDLTDFSHLLLANVSRIEILRGPQSAIWGSNAIAGIISITTNQIKSKSLQGAANIAAGNRHTQSASANISQRLSKLGFSLNASTFNTQGENISRTGDENDGYHNTDVSAGLNYSFDAYNRIDMRARTLHFTSDADSYNFATGLVGDGDDVAKGEQVSLGLNWHFAPTVNGQKDGIYSQLLSIQYSKQDTDNFSNNMFERSSRGERLRALWSNRLELAAKKWINLGLESSVQNFRQQGLTSDSDINQKRSSETFSFVSDALYALTNELALSASYRYDNNDVFTNDSSYRLGATFKINNDWRVFVSQGKAIKNPTFIERFGFFPNSFLGNPKLSPEQQKSIEAGIEANFDDISLQISAFSATLNNEILGFIFIPETGQFTAQNADTKSTRDGLELSIQGEISAFDWQAQYSYLDASEGNSAELRRSKHSGSLSTTYTMDKQNQVYIQADYAGTKFDNFFAPMQAGQIVSLKSYWLVSANYQYKHTEKMSFSLRLANLFDANYEDVFGYNTNGRSMLLTASYIW